MTTLNHLGVVHPRGIIRFLGLVLVALCSTGSVFAQVARSFDRAMVIPVKGEINDITADSIKRRLDLAAAGKTPLVIFRMDTPGGSVGPTLKICSEIKQFRDRGAKTYAWIDDQAYSAGTIIALATDGIVMAPNATMGDCQPIVSGDFGPAAVPKELEPKLVSPVLEEMRDSAHRNGYSVDLVTSMVRPNTTVFWVVNAETGRRQFVDPVKRDELFGWAGSRAGVAETSPTGGAGGRPSGSEPLPDSASRTAWQYVHEDPVLGYVRQPLVPANELLTMKNERAQAYGFSLGTVRDETELRKFFGIQGDIEGTEETWFEAIVQWLASPAVRALLFVVIVLGIYAEFHAPGVGVPGAIALGALVVFLGAPYMTGFTMAWEILAIVLGFVLLGLEVFVVPGFGVLGVAGLLLLGFGLLASFAPAEPFQRHWYDPPRVTRESLLAMVGALGGSIVGMIVLGRYLPRSPLMRRIVKQNPTHEQVTVEDPYHGIANVGDLGQAETLLHPTGKARFGAILVDVVSQGDFIASGEKVEVVEKCGNRVVVRRM